MAGNGCASRIWKGVVLKFNKFEYVRLSVINRCNLRCSYCNPLPVNKKSDDRLISLEDIRLLFDFFVRLGTKKVRITGGEPLIREDIDKIVKTISSFKEIKDISITTNGVFLGKKINLLCDSGLMRINVSLPSVNPLRYREITGVDINYVKNGIDTALKNEMKVKVNMVAYGEEIFDELGDVIDFIKDREVDLRFIEYMPLCNKTYSKEKFIPAKRIERYLIEKFGFAFIQRKDQIVRRIYSREDVLGKIGFITPVTEQFCDICNKVRINCFGEMRACLFSDRMINILNLIKEYSSESVNTIVNEFIVKQQGTPHIRSFLSERSNLSFNMVEIGG